MAYKDHEKQRAYEREWLRKRRAEWIAEHGPCQKCGSDTCLEVDHIDPTQKVTHAVWSWRKERREAELLKCQVLCRKCHKEKTSAYRLSKANFEHGTQLRYKHGCRCDLCRKAHSIHNLKYPKRQAPSILRRPIIWNDLFTPSELAQRLTLSKDWLRNQTVTGAIPHFRLSSRVVRYSERQVVDWLNAQKGA